jgi:hypothetical protein
VRPRRRTHGRTASEPPDTSRPAGTRTPLARRRRRRHRRRHRCRRSGRRCRRRCRCRDVLDIAAFDAASVHYFIGFLYLYFLLCFFVEVIDVIIKVNIKITIENASKTPTGAIHRPGPSSARPCLANALNILMFSPDNMQ